MCLGTGANQAPQFPREVACPHVTALVQPPEHQVWVVPGFSWPKVATHAPGQVWVARLLSHRPAGPKFLGSQLVECYCVILLFVQQLLTCLQQFLQWCSVGNVGMNRGDSLKGNNRGYFTEVIPPFPAEHQRDCVRVWAVAIFRRAFHEYQHSKSRGCCPRLPAFHPPYHP